MLSWALPSNGPARPGLLPAWTPPEPGQDTWHFGEPPQRLQPVCRTDNTHGLARQSAPRRGQQVARTSSSSHLP